MVEFLNSLQPLTNSANLFFDSPTGNLRNVNTSMGVSLLET